MCFKYIMNAKLLDGNQNEISHVARWRTMRKRWTVCGVYFSLIIRRDPYGLAVV